MIGGGLRDLPRLDQTRHPRKALLHGLRPLAARYARHRWDITVLGAERVPTTGPVVFVANHIGWLDGPLMATLGPRPVHALTKRESFHGSTGYLLAAAGQISVNRYAPDPAAIKSCLRVLTDGGCVGVFPEGGRGAGKVTYMHGGSAYLAMVSGATVVPLVFLGTRELGGATESIPPAGSRMAMVYGEPLSVQAEPWPRTKTEVRVVSRRLGDALRQTVADASTRTGIELPGPLPIEEPTR